VDLCGHATLASAHALWETGRLAPSETARFHTRSGLLTAVRDGGGTDAAHDGRTAGGSSAGRSDTSSTSSTSGNGSSGAGWIQMDFPLTKNDPVAPPDGLLDALGVVTPLYVGRSRFDYLVQVESEDVLRGVAPDLRRLSAIEARGVIVTSKAANPDYDFVSRFFAPRAGIDEDPVTGSAHCTLADFWHRQLGKTQFLARQLSPRGGVLRVTLRTVFSEGGLPEGDRVLLGGQAITVLRGELLA
jgi:predicted PhzF superfamily epimerase YddE/YHI9